MYHDDHYRVDTNLPREIIDESDVFIDVHKAIRRMVPAPKSRVPKGKIVEEPAKAGSLVEGNLIDVDGNGQPHKSVDDNLRRNSVEAPQPRFQLRKQYSTPNAAYGGWVTQRGATDEIREHLKHLGPSNLASRPRQTRYQSVKIKQRNQSPTRSAPGDPEPSQSYPDSEPRYSMPVVPSHQGGIGEGLLSSAGPDAKDGVQALKLGYGTMGKSAEEPTLSTDSQPPTNFSQVSIPEPVHEEHDDNSRFDDNRRHESTQGSTAVSTRSSDSQTQHEDRFRPSPYRHRGPARSGSITEQVVDVNGIRKVVLHTASSPSPSDSRASSPPDKQSQAQPDHESPYLLDEPSRHTSLSTASADPPTTDGTKKKRRRNKKRGSNSKRANRGTSEEQPLLSQ